MEDEVGMEDDELQLENLDEEEILGDTIEQIDIALSDLASEFNVEGPALKDWEDQELEFVRVSLGQATKNVWMQAKQEVTCARKSFEKLTGTGSPTLEELVAFFLGPDSDFFGVIKREVGWSYDEWGQFLKTFCLQSLYKLSVTNLFDSEGYIEQSALMTKDEYMAKMRELGSACLPNDQRAAPAAQETLWMKVEAAVNSAFRRIVVEPWIDADDSKRLESVEIVFDDNKMWHDARFNNAHLNMVQHVRDNRRGPVHHDAVASATGLIAGFRFERKKDTSISTMKAITRQQFVPAQGGTELRDLNWLFGKGDRAYTMKEGLYGFLLPSGAKARGTKKRSKDWPHSYGIELKETDERTNIPTAGAKTMWVKSVNVNGRKLYAIAYRNGNGGVTLGASTEVEDVFHWDLTLQNPADRTWFYNLSNGSIEKIEILRRSFRPLDAKLKTEVISEDLVALLEDRPIQALTMGQGDDHAWWLCRMFSQSSTSADRGFAVFDGTEDEIQHQDAWAIAKSYLSKSGARSWYNQTKEEPEEDNPAKLEDAQEQNNETSDASLVDGVIVAVDRTRILVDDEYAAMLANAIEPETEDDEDRIFIDVDAVRAALQAEGASLSKQATDDGKQRADFKKFYNWCATHRLLRPHFFKKNAAALKQLAQNVSPPCSLGTGTTTASAIYNAIKAHIEQHPDTELPADRAEAPRIELSKRQRLLKAIISAAYLKKQDPDSREHTRRGLDLERPFARKLLEDSKLGLTAGFVVHEVANVPVVERMNISHRSAIASTDFAASVETPGSHGKLELVVVEMKARVTEGTAQRERVVQGLAKLQMASSNGLGDYQQKYFAINASDESFSHFVDARKEALQILHHAYVYDVNWVLYMIGDNYGRIIAGIWIKFDVVLKSAWGDVLADMYGLSVSLLYRSPKDPSFELSEEEIAMIVPVLRTVKVAKGELDLYSFRQIVMIWRVIRLCWPKPIPPCSKLLPFIFSNWNAAKGGSDTITKMLWSIKAEIPNKLTQAHAIGRMIHLVFIEIHRCNHISTSKLALPYQLLRHYRNAGNKRFSLHRTVVGISHCFDRNTTPQTPPRRVVSLSPEVPALVGRSLRGNKPKLMIQAPSIPITGSTPQRGTKKKLNQLLAGSIAPKKNQQIVMDRVRNCIGMPVYRSSSKGLCIICGKDTNWYCIGCHVCVCMTDVARAKEADSFDCFEMDLTIPALPGSGATAKRFELTNKCYLQHHRDALFKAIGAESSD